MHESELLATIAGGLTAAFVGGYVARRLGLPVIVGYLVAGMAIGPFTPGFVADTDVAGELAEIGVILLMFGVGLHFSLRDLWSVRAIAVPGAIIQIGVATVLGTLVGAALGWDLAAGVVLGFALAVASTVVLLRTLAERRELDRSQGRIALGWLIVQDLFTVGVLVVLPAITLLRAGTSSPEAATLEIAIALAKAAVLVVVMFVVGGRVLPWLLMSVAREGSRELFTLAVLAAAIGIAFISSAAFGVSLALGAFLAGAVLAESDLSHHAASEALPLRDAFAVLFFVSVGMLVEPAFLLAHPFEVALVVLVIVAGNGLAAFGVTIAAAYPVRTALTIGAGLAQVGEFSFILARLGVDLGMLPAAGFQLAVAGAIISITLNPIAFALADRAESRLVESRAVAWFRRRGHDLATLDTEIPRRSGRRHAIVAGFGRVGSIVAGALERRGFGYVVIDQDRRLVESLRERGIPALYGDATNEMLLEEADIDHAAVLVLAMSDATTSAVALERARHANPRIEVVVRTHAEQTAARLRDEERVWPIVGERELGVQMARVTLRQFGISGPEVEAIAQGLRVGPPPAEPGRGGSGRQSGRPTWLVERLANLRSRRIRRGRSEHPEAGGEPAGDALDGTLRTRPDS